MRPEKGRIVHLADYRPTDFVLERVDLTFELDPVKTLVISRMLMHRRPGTDPDAALALDGDELQLKYVALDGNELPPDSYEATPDLLVVRNLPSGVTFELTVETIVNPEANTQLMGLYRTSGLYCTQCEAEGFRRITYAMDRPDVLGVYTITIIGDGAQNPVMLSNGNFLGAGDYGDGRRFAAWYDPHPKPSYLFALVAGDLGLVEDHFTTMSGRDVTLRIYVEHGKESRVAYAMDALKRSMAWDEQAFGREYDLDIFMIVAVSDFNMGAMENKGLNVFNDKYILADPETATDADYANIEAIVAHEYFHNWTGNRITCRDWFQLCLKEGLTVYRDHEFSADQRSRAVKRIAEVRHLKSEQFAEDAGPLAHPVRPTAYREINNFYTTTVYEKGSEVTRMIATILGRDMFRKGMDLYFERHDGQAVTIEDFLACFADVSGRDLSQFSLWYHQAGTPVLSVSTLYDPARAELVLSLEQMVPATPDQPDKAPMHIPLAMGLILADGSEAEALSASGADYSNGVLNVTGRSQTVTFSGVASRPVLSLNRGFSAPINLHYDHSKTDLAHLARHDSDLFSRWQAINILATQALVEKARGSNTPVDPTLADVIVATVLDESLEPAFRAQALTLPSEADIAREIGVNINPDAIHAGRNDIMEMIAGQNEAAFRDLVERHQGDGHFTPDAASAGRRALKNAAMTYLSFAGRGPDALLAAYRAADNMTDLAHALTLLAHRFPGSPEAGVALGHFEQRFHANALVIDKWFAIQATIPGAQTLGQVQALMASPHFNANNPNRVRSLVGAFAMSNPTGFNREDGHGYVFLADQILDIDRRNPQLAARILTAMRSWRSLEPVRADHAKAALGRISGADHLSTDVGDIVERMLKA